MTGPAAPPPHPREVLARLPDAHVLDVGANKRPRAKHWLVHRLTSVGLDAVLDDAIAGVIPASLGLWVADHDALSEADLTRSTAAALAACGPPLATARTRRPWGRHELRRLAPDAAGGNREWAGGDVRAANGYAIIWSADALDAWASAADAAAGAESSDPASLPRAWPAGAAAPPDAPAAAPPTRAGILGVDALDEPAWPRAGDARLDGVIRSMAGAPEGRRNNRLNNLAGLLARLGGSRTDAARLHAAALHAGLEPAEVDATLDSGWRHGLSLGPLPPDTTTLTMPDGTTYTFGGEPQAAPPAEPSAAAATPPGGLDMVDDLALWTPPDGYLDSQLGIAEAVAGVAAGRLRYVEQEDAWMLWSSGAGWIRWSVGDLDGPGLLGALGTLGRRWLGRRTDKGAVLIDRRTGGLYSTASGAERHLRQRCGSQAVDWDASPDHLGLPAGRCLDVLTGKIWPVDRKTLIRRSIAADPVPVEAMAASRWLAFVRHVIPLGAVRRWLRAVLGSALAGRPQPVAIAIHGAAGSGKSTLVDALATVFGSYAGSVPAQELARGGRRGHPEWRARLAGCRLLVLDEAVIGDLDAHALNSLLGSRQTANNMRAGSFDFRISAPLITTSNDAPSLGAPNTGALRRLAPVECGAAVPEIDRDPGLSDALRSDAEQGAVLRWLLDGLDDWRAGHGRERPASVVAAVDEVAADAPLSEFVALPEIAGTTLQTTEAYQAYRLWVGERGENSVSQRRFVRELVRDGLARKARTGSTNARVLIFGHRPLPPTTDASAD